MVIAGLSLLISLAYSIGLDPKNERPVTLTEAGAVAAAALSEGSIIGLMMFLFHGVGWLVTVIIDKIGWHPHWVDTVGAALFYGFGLLFLLGVVGLTTEKLTTWLFPTTGIGNAPLLPYSKPSEFSWKVLFGTLFALAIAVFTFFYVRSLFYLLFQFSLVWIGTPVSQRLEKSQPSDQNETLRLAVKTMLRACGYQIVERLQTQDIEWDRLLAAFDIVAHRQGYALAIQLKLGDRNNEPVSWTEATYLGTATRAAYRAIGFIDVPVHSVLPMLVISGRTVDDTLLRFAEQESIRIGQMPDWAEVEALASNQQSEEEVRQKAQSYLGIRPASEVRIPEPAGERS
jgi:hypothetical protein